GTVGLRAFHAATGEGVPGTLVVAAVAAVGILRVVVAAARGMVAVLGLRAPPGPVPVGRQGRVAADRHPDPVARLPLAGRNRRGGRRGRLLRPAARLVRLPRPAVRRVGRARRRRRRGRRRTRLRPRGDLPAVHRRRERRDLLALEGLRHELLEQVGGNRTTVDPAVVADADQRLAVAVLVLAPHRRRRRQLGPVPDEPGRLVLVRGTGLAGDRAVAEGRAGTGSAGLDDRLHRRRGVRRDALGERPGRLLPGQLLQDLTLLVRDRVALVVGHLGDHVRLAVHALRGERRVDRRHRDRDGDDSAARQRAVLLVEVLGVRRDAHLLRHHNDVGQLDLLPQLDVRRVDGHRRHLPEVVVPVLRAVVFGDRRTVDRPLVAAVHS